MRTMYLQVGRPEVSGDFPLSVGTLGDDGDAPELHRTGQLPSNTADLDHAGLYRALAGAACEELANQPAGSSIVLDIRADELAGCQWEAMVDEGRQVFLGHDGHYWSRGGWGPPADPQHQLGPLRVLVVVCDPADPALQAEDELEGIHRAIAGYPGRLHLEILDAPQSWPDLRKQITDLHPHVVHLIGHTRQLAGGGSRLEFSHRGATWDLDSGTVLNSWPSGPRLVVLSACRSGEQQPSTGVSSLLGAVLGARTPAVIGMQGDIRSTVAIGFATGLYGALAEEKAVDVAVAAGRLNAYAIGGPDWSYPILKMREHPASVLPIRFGANTPGVQQVHTMTEFADLRQFVDRSDQRRNAWWSLDSEGLPSIGYERGGLLITGPRDSGKSSLTRATMLTLYLRGRRLHYVDLSQKSADNRRSKDWLGALRMIRDGGPGGGLSQNLPADAFDRFTARLNWLVGRPPATGMPEQAAGPVFDECASFDHNAGQTPARIQTICADFVAALDACADPSLVLALDGIGEVDADDWRDHLMPLLIRPLLRNNRIKLLLVLSDDLAGSRLSDTDRSAMNQVRVGDFPEGQVERLVREYCARAGLPPQVLQRMRSSMTGMGPVSPSMFGTLGGIFQMHFARVGQP